MSKQYHIQGNNYFKNFIKFQNSKINKYFVFQYFKNFKKIQNLKNFKRIQNFHKISTFLKNFNISKFSKISVFIKFQNFNIWIIILKNDKTIIAYHFGQYYCLFQKEWRLPEVEIDWLIKVLRNGCFHNGPVICPRLVITIQGRLYWPEAIF